MTETNAELIARVRPIAQLGQPSAAVLVYELLDRLEAADAEIARHIAARKAQSDDAEERDQEIAALEAEGVKLMDTIAERDQTIADLCGCFHDARMLMIVPLGADCSRPPEWHKGWDEEQALLQSSHFQ